MVPRWSAGKYETVKRHGGAGNFVSARPEKSRGRVQEIPWCVANSPPGCQEFNNNISLQETWVKKLKLNITKQIVTFYARLHFCRSSTTVVKKLDCPSSLNILRRRCDL